MKIKSKISNGSVKDIYEPLKHVMVSEYCIEKIEPYLLSSFCYLQIPSKCGVDNFTLPTIVCRCNNTEVKDILHLMPSYVRRLRFDLKSQLHGHYPVPSVDLHNISHLKNLELFELTGGYRQGTNLLLFSNDTFENLTKVQELRINIVTYIKYMYIVVKPMKHLEVLDLSGTTKHGPDIVTNALAVMNKTSLKKLILSNFQMPGMKGYTDRLNVSIFFSTQDPLPLEHLDLSRNMLGVIYPSIITLLPNLKFLDISRNNLLAWTNDPLLIEMLLHPTLEVLNMETQGGSFVANWDQVQQTEETSSILKMSEPHSGPIRHSATMQKILFCINSKSNGNFSDLFNDSLVFCSTVKCIGQISSHLLKGIPCEAFGRLSDAFDSTCPFFIRFPILKKLKQFIAGNLNWVIRPTPQMTQELCMADTLLRNLSFSQNGNWIKSTFMYQLFQTISFTSTFKHLEELNLRDNNLKSIPKGYLTHLNTLDLAKNIINPLDVNVCMKYPNLASLSLASNNISFLHSSFFSSCKYLEHLDLSQNSLNLTENPLILQSLTSLRTLNLNRNKLSILPANFTSQLDVIGRCQEKEGTQGKLKVTFDDNKLICRCNAETMSFIIWFQSTTVEIPNKSSYSCSSSEGQVFVNTIDVANLKHTCFPSYTILIAETVSGTVGVIVCFFLVAALYRYRWRLQYIFIKIRKCGKRNYVTMDDITDKEIRYDAFVSYCAEDRFWVHDCLMNTLESDRYGFNLCIHYRDFPVGEDIATVIVRSIQQSRNLLIVLSECSVGRPWCQFEFQVALSEAVRRGIKLAVIKLGQFNVEVGDSSVAWVLDNHTYLEWHENKNAQKVFWYKLLRHLYGEINGTCFCLGSRQIDNTDVAAFAETDSEVQHLIT